MLIPPNGAIVGPVPEPSTQSTQSLRQPCDCRPSSLYPSHYITLSGNERSLYEGPWDRAQCLLSDSFLPFCSCHKAFVQIAQSNSSNGKKTQSHQHDYRFLPRFHPLSPQPNRTSRTLPFAIHDTQTNCTDSHNATVEKSRPA